MENIQRSVSRIISDKPIYSRFEGFCNVCKAKIYPGEQISPYFENEKNLGYDRNIIELLFKCKGKFVMFMGDDDYFNKGILEKYLHL